MTLHFDNSGSIVSRVRKKLKAGGLVEIGLINNVSDAALQATERQFMRLLKRGAGDIPFRLRCFSLPEVKRSPEAAIRIKNCYTNIDDICRSNIDGLIVTGAEPGAPSLREEPYWRALTEIIDWAKVNTLSTIWSCLAAHAAVLHLDGIERRRLSGKCSGIYDCSKVGDNWLTEDLPSSFKVSHSRLNGLDESDLRVRGYQMLSVSEDAGVDIFAKRQHSQFIFFQGHPEYEPLALQREYLRDIGRYLIGRQPIYPVPPAGYFEAPTIAALDAFRNRAIAEHDPALIANLPRLTPQPSALTGSAIAAETIFRNWLRYLENARMDCPWQGNV
jgi:homoserine O-succinyltransferase